MTSEISSDEITDMTTAVIDSFDVSSTDVTADVDYVTSGSLQISVDDDTSESEVLDAVASSLAELLNVHPRDVEVLSVDLDSGEVLYEISAESYDDATSIQSALDSLRPEEIQDVVRHELPSADVENVNVDSDIAVDVTIVVDGSEAGSIGEAKRDVETILNNQGYAVVTDVAIVTSDPTLSPTFTTLVPSPAPSITGIVVSLTLSTADEVFTADEVSSLGSQLAADYGVDVDDVTIEPTYTVTGSIDVDDIPEDVSESELEAVLEQSIADTLGVHSKDVTVTVDPSTGEVTYAVTSDSDVTATSIQETLESPVFEDALTEEITTAIPTATVSSVTSNDEIEMELAVTIDASESTTDVEEANAQFVAEFENQGFSAESESKFFHPN